MSDDVYIIGIDMIKFGRFPNKTVPELAAESILLIWKRSIVEISRKLIEWLGKRLFN